MHFNGVFSMGRKIVDFFYRPSDGAGLPTYATAGNVTLLASDLQQGIITRDCAGAARSDVLPTAAQIIDSLTVQGRAPVTGQGFLFTIRNTSGGAFATTLQTAAGLTLVGSMAVAQSNAKIFFLIITGPTTVSIYSLGGSAF